MITKKTRMMTKHPITTPTIALTSFLWGVKLATEVMVEASCSQPSLRAWGRDVLVIEGKTIALLGACGIESLVGIPM